MRSRAADVEGGFAAETDDFDATSVAKVRAFDLAQFMDAAQREGPAIDRRSTGNNKKVFEKIS